MSDFQWNTRYNLMWYYAMFFVLVYPIGERRNRESLLSITFRNPHLLRAGIPVLYFVLLYKARVEVQPPPREGSHSGSNEIMQREQIEDREANQNIEYLRFLFDSYEPRCMYFEVMECVRKLLLTGMLIFFFPETPSQVSHHVITCRRRLL